MAARALYTYQSFPQSTGCGRSSICHYDGKSWLLAKCEVINITLCIRIVLKFLIHFSFYLWAVTHNYTKVLSACGTASADTYLTTYVWDCLPLEHRRTGTLLAMA